MYRSSYKPLAQALHAALAREGVYVGSTAGYPRVECHSFIENAPLDKDGSVRVLACTIESMSTVSPEDAASMNADNLERLDSFEYQDSDFKVIGIVPTQFQDMTETSDPQKILHRALQSIDIYVQQS